MNFNIGMKNPVYLNEVRIRIRIKNQNMGFGILYKAGSVRVLGSSINKVIRIGVIPNTLKAFSESKGNPEVKKVPIMNNRIASRTSEAGTIPNGLSRILV